ncbi:glutathione peroxidase [Kordiimonas sediminis]|uniref:Glutathione peroxidase n=1 Tax=Kordiimonas sediminis TaxID=1735581 RepID=A0A919AWJ1_9PROT|nr:glutathione peroxidase [Kordiimonas sediminis]GHF29889.1 glutathione peroxidase [Kordiimonas sediminis]
MFKKLILMIAISFSVVPAVAAEEKSAHDFVLTSIDRTEMPFSQFKGKAVLVVNTASFCGYTPQYEGLQALWSEYKDKGLVVLGVPANDFGDQEPGSEENIKKFCTMNFQVDFPMTKKMVVKKADDTSEFYNYLAATLGEESRPQWNFHKYLISPEGKPLGYFASKVKPQSDELKAAIEAALPQG